jgi:hypothetical protein
MDQEGMILVKKSFVMRKMLHKESLNLLVRGLL